jgi:hypothetical protein
VTELGGPVRVLDLPGPRPLRADEVLLDVRACGVGNWDEFIRTGGWDTGARPPMALGVEAAGLVAAVGAGVTGVAVGDRVTTHSLPLRQQGAWAEQLIAGRGRRGHAAADGAVGGRGGPARPGADGRPGPGGRRGGGRGRPDGAGARGGRRHRRLLVQLAAHLGATVIATAGAAGTLAVRTDGRPLEQAAAALDLVRHGAHGPAVVLDPRPPGCATPGGTAGTR